MEEEVGSNEHLIRCNYCGRNLIVMDNVNDGLAFLSHLKNDHEIFFTFQRMTASKAKERTKTKTVLTQE